MIDATWFGPVVACALRDRMVEQARAGDKAALEQLVKFVPRDLPAWARAGWRDANIRRLGARIREMRPGAGDHAVASIIEAALMNDGEPRAGIEQDEWRELTDAAAQIRKTIGRPSHSTIRMILK